MGLVITKDNVSNYLSMEDGDVILNLAMLEVSHIEHIPDDVTHLYCGWNHLSELPQLPEGLLKLACSYNNLSSLPELPNSLKLLHCRNNELSTIQNIPPSLEYFDGRSNKWDDDFKAILALYGLNMYI